MKVIDLLNKIANGEEIPNFIIGEVEYYMGANGYLRECMGDEAQWYIDKGWLNTETRILEEPKGIPKKIKIDEKSITVKGTTFFREKDIEIFQKLSMEINEIIDYLESKGE